MESKLDLFKKVSALKVIMDENSLTFDDWVCWRDKTPCDLKIFLGVHYAEAALKGECDLTESGLEIVKYAKEKIIEFLYSNLDVEDFDKSQFI